MEDLGKRLKELRNQRGMTLTELGERTELSASYLSQIERDKSNPSLATLSNIAHALDVELRHFFESYGEDVHIVRCDDKRGRRSYIPETEHKPLTAEGGSWKISVRQVVLAPDAAELKYNPGPGEVVIFVLEGKLDARVSGEWYVLAEGDSIHYDANQPYRLSNRGDKPCTVLLCHAPPHIHQ